MVVLETNQLHQAHMDTPPGGGACYIWYGYFELTWRTWAAGGSDP